MPTRFIGITSLGIGGTGKSTIALALATEFSKVDLTVLFDTSHIYQLLKSSTISELPHAKIFGNLIILGIGRKKLDISDSQKIDISSELPYIDYMDDDTISSIKAVVEIISRRLRREVKFAIIDFTNYVKNARTCYKQCDILIIVLRPYLSMLKDILSRIGTSIKIEDKVISIMYIINMWPSNIKFESKNIKKIFGIEPLELKDIDISLIPELDIVKNENSPLAVSQYIVKKGYLKRIVEKILEMEGIKEI